MKTLQRHLLLGSALALSMASSLPAQIKPMAYETQTYIDYEVTEVEVTESSTNAVLAVFRTGEFRVVTKIDFVTSEETASEGQDYSGHGGTLVFNPGEGLKFITVRILPDEATEDVETFTVNLSSDNSRVNILRPSARVTIKDAPVRTMPPSLEILPAAEGAIVLRWDATGEQQFRLERASSPGVEPWEPVQAVPVLQDGKYSVTENTTGAIYMYRLRLNQ